MDKVENLVVGEAEDVAYEEELPKGLKVYTQNDYEVEWDIFVRGASERWLQRMRTYNNVFNMVEKMYELIIALDYKVAYGYFKIDEGKYVRSCFLVRDGVVLDTNRHFYRKIQEMEYISFVEMDVQDYIKMILREGGDVRLMVSLIKPENVWKRHAKMLGIKSII